MMIRALRWLLVAPMAALGWIIAFTGALALYSVIDAYCPEQIQVSHTCTWGLAVAVQDTLVVVGATFSAIFWIAFATVTAPDHKARVAMAAFLVGFSLAVWAYLQTNALSALLGATSGGFLTLLVVLKWHARRRVSGYRQYQLFV